MTGPSGTGPDGTVVVPTTKLGVFSWFLYDWANSAYTTVIVTFVFATYFAKGIAPNEILGTEFWGYAISLSALAVALSGPVLGAIADRTGRRKPWIAVFTLICVIGTATLWWAEPKAESLLWILVAVGISNFAFEMGMVFYNAMLPDMAPPGRMGRLSGWGWGLGYVGGLICLAVALFTMVQADPPWFGLSTENAEHLRATSWLVAIWFAVFSIPLFLFTADKPRTSEPLGDAMRNGLAALVDTARKLKDHKTIVRFLIARMIYADGLTTLFAFGGIYAVGTFGMEFSEVIILGIAMNVSAGLGALAFAWVDDRVGSKPTILIAVGALTILGGVAIFAPDKDTFWAVAVGLGIFVGPVQAASRSLMGHLAPQHLRTEMFGLFALSGKATAFMGPALLAFITATFQSQRAGMATILVFFAVGFVLLWGVKVEKG